MKSDIQIYYVLNFLKIYEGDGLPSQICTNCIIQVTQAYNFKQQVEGSDATLRQCLNLYKNDGQTVTESNSANNSNLGVKVLNLILKFVKIMLQIFFLPMLDLIQMILVKIMSK